MNGCIAENARIVQKQEEYSQQYNALVKEYDDVISQFQNVKETILEKQTKYDAMSSFLEDLARTELLTEFDKDVWISMVEELEVSHDGLVEIKVWNRDYSFPINQVL